MAIEAVPVVPTPGTPPPPPEGVTITNDGQVIPNELMPQGEDEKLFAGKYKSVEELEKGYLEAQKALGAKPKAEEPKIPTPPVKSEEQNTDPQQDPDIASIGEEYAKSKSITEEQYATLEKKGFNRETVNEYIRGQEALAQQTRADMASVVGGEEQMQAVLKWASTALKPDEIAAYNAALETRNPQLAKLALAGVAAKYQQEFPSEPTRTQGKGAVAASGPVPFANPTEMLTAMNDKRYDRDRVYRSEIERRIMASPRW